MSDSLPPGTPQKPPDSRSDREIMKISDVADLLKVSRTTVRRLCERKELPAKKFGAQWRIRLKDVLAMWDQPA
jgi:excisionase family DNA binding protein